MIDPERLRAMVRLLGPAEMTPTAKRMLLALADEADNDNQPSTSDLYHPGVECDLAPNGECLNAEKGRRP